MRKLAVSETDVDRLVNEAGEFIGQVYAHPEQHPFAIIVLIVIVYAAARYTRSLKRKREGL